MTSEKNTGSATPWLVAGSIIAGAGLLVAAVAATTTALVARSVVIPPKRPTDDARIIDVDRAAKTVTLSATADTLLPGRYSLFFNGRGGHAKVGEILSVSDGTVVRELLAVDYGTIEKARFGRISGWFYVHPREFGFGFRDVSIPTALGEAPAWLIPAEGSDATSWAIHVHGRAVRRGETLRSIPVFREAGFTSLHVSYRNDGDAPRSDDGRYALGDTEWQDVEAAIDYAIENGATRIVLFGWSMGGAIVLQTLVRGRHRAAIAGIVLDSPVIDWRETLQYRAQMMGLPERIGSAALGVISGPLSGSVTGQSKPIPLSNLDFVDRAQEIDLPVLLLHSDDDGYVSPVSSRELAIRQPNLVSFVPFGIARHTKLWNYDQTKWTSAIAGWLARLP